MLRYTTMQTTHKIILCEPAALCAGDTLDNIMNDCVLDVDENMYTTILNGPEKEEYIYIFGNKYPYSEYIIVGNHGNDAAQTGFIDVDLYNKDIDTGETIEDTYASYDHWGWDNRDALLEVRKLIPHVLFIGETEGGDVGATLYVHKSDNVINSIVVSPYPIGAIGESTPPSQ
jgi:hypothetical protein